jgi:Protein of unknown function (DUF1566)
MNVLSQHIASNQPRFVDNGDGTITDTKLRLMWTKATLCTKNVDQYEAEKICKDCRVGGYSDWDLPEVEPLFFLADRTRYKPAIDTAFFPDTHSDWYWTRTLAASAPSAAWIVYFSGGGSCYGSRGGSSAFVRACRALPAGQ